MFDYVEKRINEKMSIHTTLHIGGNARWFLLPRNEDELQRIIFDCREMGIEHFVLGAGSNLLVSDEGFSGAVISMEKFKEISLLSDGRVRVGAGVNLFELNMFCAKNGLGGLEWSYGIPASVGGACRMNAGAFGGEFCERIENIKIFDGFSLKKRKKIKYSYRKGCLKKNEILISATLKLEKKNSKLIIEEQNCFLNLRKEKQPYGKFSLGSVFKRDEKFMPAKVIDDLGLKGKRVGGVCVSDKHSGFIINDQNGSAKDFLNLVEEIEGLAKQKGYLFKREFINLGFGK